MSFSLMLSVHQVCFPSSTMYAVQGSCVLFCAADAIEKHVSKFAMSATDTVAKMQGWKRCLFLHWVRCVGWKAGFTRNSIHDCKVARRISVQNFRLLGFFQLVLESFFQCRKWMIDILER